MNDVISISMTITKGPRQSPMDIFVYAGIRSFFRTPGVNFDGNLVHMRNFSSRAARGAGSGSL